MKAPHSTSALFLPQSQHPTPPPVVTGRSTSGDIHPAAERSTAQQVLCCRARVGHVCPGSALAMEASAQRHRNLPRKVTRDRPPCLGNAPCPALPWQAQQVLGRTAGLLQAGIRANTAPSAISPALAASHKDHGATQRGVAFICCRTSHHHLSAPHLLGSKRED